MFMHIVMWRLSEQENRQVRDEHLLRIKSLLEALPKTIAEIQSFQVGVNECPSDAAADLVLVSGFESLDALNRYQVHPDHLAAAAIIKPLVSERRVVDYVV